MNKKRIAVDADVRVKQKNFTEKSFKNEENLELMSFKTKTEFQKKLMNENNMIKYKAVCLGLLKEDEELKKFCEICDLNINLVDNFIENTLFSDKIFLYKLETMLLTETTKIKKEKFFKDEMKKYLDLMILDIEYENKMRKLNVSIDSYISKIKQFDFLK
jgi:hypothetical protein